MQDGMKSVTFGILSVTICLLIYIANCTEKSTFAVKTPYEKDEGGNDSHFF